MRPLYLDHAAAAPLREEVREHLLELLADPPLNPASLHPPGLRASALLRRARESVAELLDTEAGAVLFTSGGTEANHAVFRALLPSAGPGDHVVHGGTEHASLLGAVQGLAALGVERSVVAPDAQGRIAVEAVLSALRPNTKLVSLHAANNETGVIQPVESLAAALADRGIALHVDAAASLGRRALSLARHPGLTAVTLSGPKLGALAGSGALVVRPGTSLVPWMAGGKQERGLRGGTVNLVGASALGVAARLAREELRAIPRNPPREIFEAELVEVLGPAVTVHGAGAERLPTVSSIAIASIQSAELLERLAKRGLHASAGSACHAGSPEPSAVLRAMGVPPELARCTIRCSFALDTGASVSQEAARRVAECVPRPTHGPVGDPEGIRSGLDRPRERGGGGTGAARH